MCLIKNRGQFTRFAWNSVTQVGIDTTQIGVDAVTGNPVIDGRPVFVFDSNFNIVNPIFVMTYDDGDPCCGRHPFQFVCETFTNTESFADNRDFGYSIGIQYGPAVSRQERGDWKIYYTWNDVQQEAVFTPVAQDDFLRATNFRGHWIGMDLFVWKGVQSRLWILSDRPILPIDPSGRVDFVNGSQKEEWRGRLDITLKF